MEVHDPGGAGHHVRVGHQPQDRYRPRPDDPAAPPVPGGRGHQVEAQVEARRGVANEGAGSKELKYLSAAHGDVPSRTRHWSRRPTAYAALQLPGAAHRGRSASEVYRYGFLSVVYSYHIH
jgi:hypothetical protein